MISEYSSLILVTPVLEIQAQPFVTTGWTILTNHLYSGLSFCRTAVYVESVSFQMRLANVTSPCQYIVHIHSLSVQTFNYGGPVWQVILVGGLGRK